MEKTTKKLIIIFFTIVIIKFLLSALVAMPTAFSDDYSYLKMSQSLWKEHSLAIHGDPATHFPPLYPILISPANISDDGNIVFLLIKLLNSILSTLVIIPIYLLSKEILKKTNLLLITTLTIIPGFFSLTPYIMAENLFYFLALLTVYFLYKIECTDKAKYGILFGICLGLAFLTKVTGVILVISTIILIICDLIKKNKIKNKIIGLSMSAIFALPWLVWNKAVAGSHLGDYQGIGNRVLDLSTILSAVSWPIIYAGAIMIASGFLGVHFFKKATRNTTAEIKTLIKITAIITISAILFLTYLSLGPIKYETPLQLLRDRPMTRYIEFVIPLVMICSFANQKKEARHRIAMALFLGLSAFNLSCFPLLPPNNPSLTLLFALRTITTPALTGIIIGATIYVLLKTKLNLLKTAFIIFTITNALCLTATYLQSMQWEKTEQLQLSQYINDNYKGKTILMDEKYKGTLSRTEQDSLYAGEREKVTIIGLLNTNKITIGATESYKNYDLAVTRDRLPLRIIKETTSGIRVYEAR